MRDSKRALDEYTSEIFMGGRNTIAVHNTCEDSLLAAPIILDLVILAELMSRIRFGKVSVLLCCGVTAAVHEGLLLHLLQRTGTAASPSAVRACLHSVTVPATCTLQ